MALRSNKKIKVKGRTAKVSAEVLVRRVVVIVLVLVLVLGVVREADRRLVCQAGGVTRPSHSAAEIRICNTQQPLPTTYPLTSCIDFAHSTCGSEEATLDFCFSISSFYRFF